MKNKYLYIIYYSVLILILALYTNMRHSPNMLIRFGYLAAIVLPVLQREELVCAVIICTLGISKNTFAHPLMPTDMYYYVALVLLLAYLSLLRRGFKTGIKLLFLIAIIYVVLIDLITQDRLSQMVSMIFICIMFYMCIEDKIVIGSRFLTLSFIIISLTISYWVLFCPSAHVASFSEVKGMSRTGWTDPNYLSSVLGAGLILAIRELLLKNRNLLYKSFMALIVTLSVIAMLKLASRGIIIAVVLSVVVLMSFSKVNKWTKAVVIVLSIILVVVLYNHQYFEFIIARFEEDDGTGSHRTEIWLSKLSDFFYNKKMVNWFFGVGQFEGFKMGEYFGLSVVGVSTHNDFVSFLVYYGFVGIALFFSVIAYPLRVCSKAYRPQILALLLYMLACGMTIEPLARGMFVNWGFFFYIIVLAKQSQNMNNNRQIV